MKSSTNVLSDGEKMQSHKHDIIILSKDLKFRKLVMNSKKTLDDEYYTFMNYEGSIKIP